MSLIRLEKVSLAYGDKPLLADVDFVVEPGARLCLLGRNGEGKSTMMSVLRGDATPDVGDVIYDSGLKIGSLPQSLPPADDKRAFDLVTEAFGELGAALSEYQILTASQDVPLSDAQLERMDTLQHIIEKADAWQYLNDISQILKRFGIAPETKMESLSGGWRRRVMLAKALVNQPDLLLLDEPTNHLDINTIRWLEEQLQTFQGAMLFVSHDRAFIKSLAAQILELDRGRLRHFRGSYTDYLAEKEKLLADEQTQNKLFDKKLSEEETWIRQGIKARRTRNEGRVRALKALREERKQRLDKQGKAALRIESASPSGKLVAEATDISFQYGEKTIVSGFSTTILRGDRIGLIGSNGAGKTTLLRILLGQLAPTAGQVRQGSKLEIAYFDQLRDGLDPEKTVIDSVADGHEYVTLSGRDRHVISYLNDFLFTSQRARSPVKSLSGGETNRLLLAKLFAKPANLIVMDEPTNDLDVDTLELLEEKLTEFDGTLLLTSHDRDFLDQVVTSTMVFEGDGKISEYVGGYDDWVRQTGGEMADESTFAQNSAKSQKSQIPDAVSAPPVKASQNATSKTPARKKLSYKLQRELEQLPALIEQLEESIEAQQALIAAPDFFSGAHELIESETTKLSQLEAELAQAMDRWVELEEEANQ